MKQFQQKRPAGFIDLMVAFESRKRGKLELWQWGQLPSSIFFIFLGCSPNKITPLNIALPFSFIDFYRKTKGKDVGSAINKYGNRDIRWVSHGMLRIDVSVMKDLFEVA